MGAHTTDVPLRQHNGTAAITPCAALHYSTVRRPKPPHRPTVSQTRPLVGRPMGLEALRGWAAGMHWCKSGSASVPASLPLRGFLLLPGQPTPNVCETVPSKLFMVYPACHPRGHSSAPPPPHPSPAHTSKSYKNQLCQLGCGAGFLYSSPVISTIPLQTLIQKTSSSAAFVYIGLITVPNE